jgi:hypothetical protein
MWVLIELIFWGHIILLHIVRLFLERFILSFIHRVQILKILMINNKVKIIIKLSNGLLVVISKIIKKLRVFIDISKSDF